MRYLCKVSIHANLKQVTDLFLDYKRMPEWQTGLTKVNLIEGAWKKPHSKVEFHFQFGDQEMVMLETLERNNPHEIIQIYESGPVWNRCINQFKEENDKVIYTMDTEFQFKEAMEINQDNFMKQSQLGLQLFKEFVESNQL